MIQATGQVRVRIDATGEEQTLDAAELEWDAIDADERQMGLETHWQATWELTDRDGGEHVVEWNTWEVSVPLSPVT